MATLRRILALESAGESSSVALVQQHSTGEHDFSYCTTDSGQSHSSALLPLARGLLNDKGLTWSDLDGLVVGVGPGSFTGLRIACGLVQGLALGTGLPVLAVNGFELHAYMHAHAMGFSIGEQRYELSFDARLGERFAAALTLSCVDDQIGCEWIRPPSVMAQADWDALVSSYKSPTSSEGAGTVGAWVVLKDPLPQTEPLAAWMARFAVDPRCAERHQWRSPRDLVPLYVREKVAQTIAERQAVSDLIWSPMSARDLASVMVIERQAYPFPWTSGNFKDSIAAGYEMSVLKERGVMIGYLVWMAVMDEAHLLNLALSPARHRRGLGNAMMKHFIGEARSRGMNKILLEVRPSNLSAIRLYRRFGFGDIGVRKGYYPNSVSDPAQDRREDAIVMQLELAQTVSGIKESIHA